MHLGVRRQLALGQISREISVAFLELNRAILERVRPKCLIAWNRPFIPSINNFALVIGCCGIEAFGRESSKVSGDGILILLPLLIIPSIFTAALE